MSFTATILKVVRVVLEYGMLLWLIYFVGKLVRGMFLDVKKESRAARKPEVSPREAILSVVDAREPELSGQRFAFGEQITIGRGSDNDVVIPESFVSHHHAAIYRHGSQYIVEDLGSVNHTYVNDQELEGRAYIQAGDVLRIGLVTLKFER